MAVQQQNPSGPVRTQYSIPSFSASDPESANVAMIVLIVLAIALFVTSRVQKRKDVQITPTRCDRPDLHQRESFGRQMEESRLLSGKNSVRQPKPYLLFLPAELKAVILRNLTSFQDLKNLTQAIATYHVIADRDNIFTEATMNGLESRDVSFLPRDVALPEPRTFEGLSIKVRVPGLASNCEQLELLQAFEAYIKIHTMNGIRFRLTFEQCLALQSVLDVEEWAFILNAKPGPLAKDVDNPRETINHCVEYVPSANSLEANTERNINHKETWVVSIARNKKSFTSMGHLHYVNLDCEPGGRRSGDLCEAWIDKLKMSMQKDRFFWI